MSSSLPNAPAMPHLSVALVSITESFRRMDASRRSRAEAFVRQNCGPGISDRHAMTWQHSDGGARHFGSFSDFLAMVDCNRFEVEVDLACGIGPHRRVRVEGWVLELDLRAPVGGRV